MRLLKILQMTCICMALLSCADKIDKKEHLPQSDIKRRITPKVYNNGTFDSLDYDVYEEKYYDAKRGKLEWSYTTTDSSEVKKIHIRKFISSKVTAFVYDYGNSNRDTLEIYNDTIVFNRVLQKIEKRKEYTVGNQDFKISKSIHSHDHAIYIFFIDDNNGLICYRSIAYGSNGFTRFDTRLAELQNKIASDSVFSGVD